jgi:hypothetical protein
MPPKGVWPLRSNRALHGAESLLLRKQRIHLQDFICFGMFQKIKRTFERKSVAEKQLLKLPKVYLSPVQGLK